MMSIYSGIEFWIVQNFHFDSCYINDMRTLRNENSENLVQHFQSNISVFLKIPLAKIYCMAKDFLEKTLL